MFLKTARHRRLYFSEQCALLSRRFGLTGAVYSSLALRHVISQPHVRRPPDFNITLSLSSEMVAVWLRVEEDDCSCVTKCGCGIRAGAL